MTSNLIAGWEVVIGLEVHAQIATKSKLFSSTSTEFGADPNEHVSFYDAAFPGQLPVLNGHAVDLAIKTGFAINGTVHKISRFDRKNYFYPDLPSGYQITQLFHPIVTDGYVDITTRDGETKRINIERIHIEQDAGKSMHDLDPHYSYVDLNRAGIPLMEIVSKPDIRSSDEAMSYVKDLRTILRYIGSCDCNMEKGNLRVDANISIHKPGMELGTRAEIKNINSIKFLGDALDYEIKRQISEVESGNKIVQETRLFDSKTGTTRSMRSKEDAAEYRYFPDPDLKPVILEQSRIDRLRSELPELPAQKSQRFMEEYGVTVADAAILVEDRETSELYEAAVHASANPKISAKKIANWIIVELFAALNKDNKTIHQIPFPIEYMALLVDLIVDGTISGKIAKDVFETMWQSGKNPRDIVQEMGLQQVQDDSVILAAIQKVLDSNPENVEQYKAGKDRLFGYFIGQVMKELKGKGNPGKVNSLLKQVLEGA